MRLKLVGSLLLILLVAAGLHASTLDKLTVEQIVGKHLDSIGTQEQRSKTTTQMAIGDVEFSILRVGSGKSLGRVVLASEDRKLFFGAMFNSAEYPSEKFSFDGTAVNVANIRPGLRSPLGNFVQNNKHLLSEGLLGGCLTSSWALFDTDDRKAKLNTAGTKKIDGKETYVVEYSPKRGADIVIRLYFDSTTFRHVRTEYRQTFSAAQGLTPEQSSRQNESKQVLTEEFSEFSAENNLTLPHKYRLHLLLDGASTTEFEWKFQMTSFLFNQKLDAKSFDINSD